MSGADDFAALLARPVWHALAGRQRGLARGDDRARRFDPAVASFAAAAGASPEALAALSALAPEPGATLLLVERDPVLPPGFVATARRTCVQMVAARVIPGPVPIDLVELGAADAADMLALATLTVPGPFFSRTHEFGGFVGVRRAGKLVAMAGERLKLPGLSEVSGVCTHPDARGQGLAEQLSRVVAERIIARGERPFLHSYAENATAVGLYQRLGFSIASEVIALSIEREAKG